MMWRTLLRIAGALLLVDGILVVVLGKAYIRPWRIVPGPVRRLIAFLLVLPGVAVRLMGLGEMVLGLRILGAAPLGVRQVYRYAADRYDYWRDLFRLALVSGAEGAVDSAVRQYLPPGGKVLDLGCGTGANLERILRLHLPFGSYTGVDLSPDMLAVAKGKFAGISTARFVQMDLLGEPIPNGDYDLVISTWLLSHIPDPLLLIEKARAKTKLGGYAILLFFSRSGSWLDAVADLLLAPISDHPVPREAYLNFPGRVSIQRFNAGLVTMMVLANVKLSELIE